MLPRTPSLTPSLSADSRDGSSSTSSSNSNSDDDEILLTPHGSATSPAFKQLQSALGWQGRFDDIQTWAKDVDERLILSPCPVRKRKRPSSPCLYRGDMAISQEVRPLRAGLLLTLDAGQEDHQCLNPRRMLWPNPSSASDIVKEEMTSPIRQFIPLGSETDANDAETSRQGSSRYQLGTHLTLRNKSKMAEQLAQLGPCRCLSFFFKSPKQMVKEGLSTNAKKGLRDALHDLWGEDPEALKRVFPHASNCQNLAERRPIGMTFKRAIRRPVGPWARTMLSLHSELTIAEGLGISHLVVHPGSGSVTDRTSVLRTVSSNIDTLLKHHPSMTIVIESMVGLVQDPHKFPVDDVQVCRKGSAVGCTFLELSLIRRASVYPDRVKFCIDLAHVHAMSFDLACSLDRTLFSEEVDDLLGAENVVCMHVSDTPARTRSQAHRHCGIGLGTIGSDGIRAVVRDPLFTQTCFILETPRYLASDIRTVRIERLEAERVRAELQHLNTIISLDDEHWRPQKEDIEHARQIEWAKLQRRFARAVPKGRNMRCRGSKYDRTKAL